MRPNIVRDGSNRPLVGTIDFKFFEKGECGTVLLPDNMSVCYRERNFGEGRKMNASFPLARYPMCSEWMAPSASGEPRSERLSN